MVRLGPGEAHVEFDGDAGSQTVKVSLPGPVTFHVAVTTEHRGNPRSMFVTLIVLNV